MDVSIFAVNMDTGPKKKIKEKFVKSFVQNICQFCVGIIITNSVRIKREFVIVKNFIDSCAVCYA